MITTADADFAECNCTRQRAVGISLYGKGFFAKCRMSGTRQRISRVPRRHSAKKSRRDGQVTVTAPLPSATRRHSAKKCVFFFKCFAECLHMALGKACFLFFWICFAECLDHGTRQSWEAQCPRFTALPSVMVMTLGKEVKKLNFFFVFSLPSLQTRYTSYIYI